MVDSQRLLSRRTLLRGAAGGAAFGFLPGCRLQTSAPTPVKPTFTTLLDEVPFAAAHRGGGGDWPEMTAYAYEQAVQLPEVHALEVSVCLSSDGVLVCSHDSSLKRVSTLR